MDISRRLTDLADRAYSSGWGVDSDFLTPDEYALYLEREAAYRYAEPKVYLPSWERKLIRFGPGDPELAYLQITSKAGSFIRLKHPDFLGAILGSGLERRMVGDLFITPEGCLAIVKRPAGKYLEKHLARVGSAPVELTVLEALPQLPEAEHSTAEYVLSSLRLDRFIATVFRRSRSLVQQQIEEGLVFVDGRPEKRPHFTLPEGSSVSLRKTGKVTFERIKGESRRGSFIITVTHYK